MNSAGELVDARGRKYLTADERRRFLAAARAHPEGNIKLRGVNVADING